MKLKIFLGIIIPIIIVIVLISLGSVDVGFSMKKSFQNNISANEIFRAGYSNNAFRVGEIQVKNDYFLPKRIDAPAFLACLYDKEGQRPLQNAGAIFYNEGEYSEDTRSLDLGQIAYSSKYYYDSGYRNYKTNIEIGAHQMKKLQVYYSSTRYYYDSAQQDPSQRDYDYLILIEQDEKNQITCEGLSSEDLQDATKINILQPAEYCYDTDEVYNQNNDYYSIRNRLSQFGSCTDSSNSTKNDYCQDSDNLVEFSCLNSPDEKCRTNTYSCKSYGFIRCENGVCV